MRLSFLYSVLREVLLTGRSLPDLQDVPYLAPHLGELVKFQLMAAANSSYGDDARVMALNSLVWLIKFKKSRVQSLNLSQTIIEGLLPIGAEAEDVDDELEGESGDRARRVEHARAGLEGAVVCRARERECS